DFHVTGVQTCALPILQGASAKSVGTSEKGALSTLWGEDEASAALEFFISQTANIALDTGQVLTSRINATALMGYDRFERVGTARSEERRVGKEGRCRG